MSIDDPASYRRRWLTAIVLCVAQVLIVVDQNIVNVALPAIREDLEFSQSSLVWTVNAYVIPFGGLLLLAGRLGDLLSRKYVFLTGITAFTVASLACGTATEQWVLLTARFVQGAGGAVTAAGLLGMIVTLFPQPRQRAKAIGAFGFASAGGSAGGMVVGGVLTEALSWHWIFFINVPLGLLIAVPAWRLLPSERGPGWRAGTDVTGAVLVTAGLMLGVYTLIAVEHHGWGSPRIVGGGVVALLMLAGFFRRQATTKTPLLPLRILRSRNVAGANVVQALMIGSMFGFMFFTVLYLQQVLGYQPLQAGLAFLPAPIIIAVISMAAAPRLLSRFTPRAVTITGMATIIVGFGLLSRITPTDAYLGAVLPGMVVLAAGFGVTMPALMGLAMSESTPAESGVISGLFSTTQQVGGAVGLAVLSSVVGARTQTALDDGAARLEALTGGYQQGFLVCVGFIALGLLIAVTILKTPTPAEQVEPITVVPASLSPRRLYSEGSRAATRSVRPSARCVPRRRAADVARGTP